MRSPWEGCRQSRAVRGQSTTLGFVLVFAIVLGGTTLVLVAGSGALADAQQDVGIARAEKSLAEVDSKAAMVGLGQSSSQSVSLATAQDGDYRVNDTAGNINVTLFPGGGGSTVLVDQKLGELRYESGRTTVAYQGGGVWRKTGNGSTMVSPPEFHYRDLTLTLPVVRIDGQGSVGDSVTVSQNETAIGKFPTSSIKNPLNDARVRVKIRSEYYRAWGAFFRERTEGNATVYHSNNTAVLDLVTPAPDQPEPIGAVVSGAAGDEIVLDNNACMDAYRKSSSHGGSLSSRQNCDNSSPNGTVYSTGGVKLDSGNTEIRGNVTLGGNLSIPGGKVKGYVKCTKGNHDCEDSNVGSGDVEDAILNVDTEVPDPTPVDDTVDNKIQEFRVSNDNSGAADVVYDDTGGDDWRFDVGEDATVGAGNYYVDKLVRANSGKTLTLDTTGGDINIAVDGSFDLDSNTIKVEGKNRVRIYMTEDIDFTGGTVKVVDGGRTYNSSQFWVYGNSGFDADLDSGSEFTGVIYAPEGPSSSAGTVTMSDSVVHGAIVAHVDGMDSDAAIHYDERLGQSSIQRAASPDDPRVTNVHLTVNRVNVTG